MSAHAKTDLQLVLETVAGSDESFAALTERYSRPILGLLYSYTRNLESARDLTQETLLKAALCRSLAMVGTAEAIPALHTLARNTASVEVNKAALAALKELGERRRTEGHYAKVHGDRPWQKPGPRRTSVPAGVPGSCPADSPAPPSRPFRRENGRVDSPGGSQSGLVLSGRRPPSWRRSRRIRS